MLKIAALDIETTGLKAEEGEILEVGLVGVNDSYRCNNWYHTTLPDDKTESAIKINRLTKERIDLLRLSYHTDSSPRYFTDHLDSWQLRINEFDIIIAHNAQFDIGWLTHHGINFDGIKIVCTQELMKKHYPERKWWSLKNSLSHLGLEYDESQHHGAIYDAQCCARIFNELAYRELLK